MKNGFEDKFMELQSDFISLCIEFAPKDISMVYAYCSIEETSRMFNAFFMRNGEIVETHQFGYGFSYVANFLKIGTTDIGRIIELCKNYETKVPTEMKMVYNVCTGKYNADYKYDAVCPANSEKSAEDVFYEWIELEKRKIQ